MKINFFYIWTRGKKKNKSLSADLNLPKVLDGVVKIFIPETGHKKADPYFE